MLTKSIADEPNTRPGARKPWVAPQVIVSAVEHAESKTLVSNGPERHTSTSTLAS